MLEGARRCSNMLECVLECARACSKVLERARMSKTTQKLEKLVFFPQMWKIHSQILQFSLHSCSIGVLSLRTVTNTRIICQGSERRQLRIPIRAEEDMQKTDVAQVCRGVANDS
eukprot:6492082-Amphidinium_carterae.1